MLFDPVSVIATQLTEVVRAHAGDLLGRQEVQALVDTVRKAFPVVVKEALQELTLGDLQKVLQNLVQERVSIRDLVLILECLADHAAITKDPDMLTEFVRVRLCSSICQDYVNNECTLQVLTLDPEMERTLQRAISRDALGLQLQLEPQLGHEILQSLAKEIASMQERGLQPIVLTTPDVRPALRRLTMRSFPSLVVLSWNEIAPRVLVNSLSMASL
jgi:flagellar biosynthesis protein FlhA